MPNVLVIDDTKEVRMVVVQTLIHYGFSAKEAPDGKTGIQMAQNEPPDLIICDVRMPGMDGYETLAAIRDIPAIASIPFIFLTAEFDQSEVRRGMVSGADDYLVKPFRPQELLEAVTTRIARRSEIQTEVYKRAEKLSADVVKVFSREAEGPINAIQDLSSDLMRDYEKMPREKVLEDVKHISESAVRLNELAKSLG